MRGRLAAIAIASAAVGLFAAPAAEATFHLMQIREVYPGSLANPDSDYVELQMWAAGQNHVAAHVLRTYDAAGTVTSEDAFPGDLPNGADQSTMVLATAPAESQFSFKADAAIPLPGPLSAAGGAVCWESIDCVTWGNFHGSLAIPVGSPALPGGIPDGMALRRTIAPGCATLLEPRDDSDNSAADFAAVLPGPRPNSAAPSERSCVGGGPGGSNQGAPQTSLRGKPPKRSHDRTPTFRFVSNQPGSAFECALDRHRFRRCHSPLTAKPLTIGRHVFKVRAVGSLGRADRSPATYAFKILPKR